MSNLFDAFASTLKPTANVGETQNDVAEPTESCLDSEDTQETEPAEILDLEALNAFTIPKRKKKRESFEQISVDGRHFKELDVILRQSFKSVKENTVFSFTKCYLVNNEKLQKEYGEKKKEMKKDGRDVQESYAFQHYALEVEARRDSCTGLKIKNSSITCLGNPELGVYLCKHADVISPSNLPRGYIGTLAVFKVIKGKVKSMVENWNGEPLDPTPHFDCHVSKSAKTSDSFESSQIYFYEYDEFFDTVERPRQILPYALITFVVQKDQRPRVAPTKQSSVQRTSTVSSPLLVNQTNTVQPLLGIQLPSQRSHIAPSTSLYGSHNALENTTSSPKTAPVPVPVATAPAKVDSIPTRIGKPPEDGDGVIVWSGNLTNNDKSLCDVDLIAYGDSVRPALIGNKLCITKTVNWNTLLTLVLNNLVCLSKDSETRVGESYYSYYRLKPMPTQLDMFKALVQYFRSKQRGAYVELDEVKVLLLPTCEITHNFKITSPGESLPDVLHCVFISQCSRDVQLKGRVGMKNVAGGSSALNGMTFYSSSSTEDVRGEESPSDLIDMETLELQSLGAFSYLKDPPKPSRKIKDVLCFPDKDFLYEDGFKLVPMSTCRLNKNILTLEFLKQVEIQDRRNIEEAKKARNKDAKRTLSSDNKSDTNVTSSKSSQRLSGLESLKNQPLFSELPVSDSSSRDSSVRDPRSWKQSSQNSSTSLASKHTVAFEKSVHSPATYKKLSDSSKGSDKLETRKTESGYSDGGGSKTTPMQAPPAPPSFITQDKHFPNYFSSKQTSPHTPSYASASTYQHSSQSNLGYTPPTKKALLATPPAHQRLEVSSIYGQPALGAVPNEQVPRQIALQTQNQNLEQGPSVGQPQQLQSQVPSKSNCHQEITQITGPIPTEGRLSESNSRLGDSPLKPSNEESPSRKHTQQGYSSRTVSPSKSYTQKSEILSHSPTKPINERQKIPTHSPRKSLITSLPLPPTEMQYENSEASPDNKMGERDTGKVIKDKSAQTSDEIKSSSKEKVSKMDHSSSSSDEEGEHLLTDDIVDDIIKMRPVKALQNLQTSKPKDDTSDKETKVKAAEKTEKFERAKSPKRQSSKDTDKKKCEKPEAQKQSEHHSRKDSEKTSTSEKASTSDDKQNIKVHRHGKNPDEHSSHHDSKKHQHKEKDLDSHGDKKKVSNSHEKHKVKEKKKKKKRRRSPSGDKLRLRKRVKYFCSSDEDSSDVDYTKYCRFDYKKFERKYKHLIKPCFVKLRKLSKKDIAKWTDKKRHHDRKHSKSDSKHSKHSDSKHSSSKHLSSKHSTPKKSSSKHSDSKHSKKKHSRIDFTNRLPPPKPKIVTESHNFIHDVLKSEGRKRLSKIKEKLGKDKSKMKVVQVMSSSFSGEKQNKENKQKGSSSEDPIARSVRRAAEKYSRLCSLKAKKDDEEKKKEERPKMVIDEDSLVASVSASLHKNAKPKECTLPPSQESNRTFFWSIALHYLIDLHRIIDGKAVHIPKPSAEETQRSSTSQQFGRIPKKSASESSSIYKSTPRTILRNEPVFKEPFAARAPQVSSASRATQAPHPWRNTQVPSTSRGLQPPVSTRPPTVSNPRTNQNYIDTIELPTQCSREMQIEAFSSIKEYYSLPEMTNHTFMQRLEAFKARVRALVGRPRFVGYRFQRSSLEDVEENFKRGNKEEIEEYEFTEKDVKNFTDYVTLSNEEEVHSKQPGLTDRNSNSKQQERGSSDKPDSSKHQRSHTVSSFRRVFTQPPASPTSSSSALENDEELSTHSSLGQTDGEFTMDGFRSKLGSDDGDWPDLNVVDVPNSKRVYTARSTSELPELLNRQVIKSRDPRLSIDLPKDSVYNGLADTPQEPDSPDSFHSAEWGASRLNESKGDAQPTKVHVNPKFFPKLLSGSVSQDDINHDEVILRENVSRGGGFRDSDKRDRGSRDRSREDVVRDEDMFDDEMILLQQGFLSKRPLADDDKREKRLKKELDENKERRRHAAMSPPEREKGSNIFKPKDFDADDEILLQQTFGRRSRKDSGSKDRRHEKGSRREKGEKISCKDDIPKPVSRLEAGIRSPMVDLQQERPVSRNSERSLGSLEQEKARIEEMLLREQMDRTPRSIDTGTPQRPAASDDVPTKNEVKAERSHMARRTVKNTVMDTNESLDRRTKLKMEMENRQGAFSSYAEDLLERKTMREIEVRAMERRKRLERLKTFHRSTMEPSKKLSPLSSITRNLYEQRNTVETNYTDKSYLKSRRDMLDDIDLVCQGVRSRYDQYYGHLRELSVQTQLEASMIPDFPILKRTYFESLRDWMRLRPLDALVAGRLRAGGLRPTLLKTSRVADETSENCQRMLAKNTFYLFKGKQYKQEPGNLYKRPEDTSEEVGNDAFRQVRHYMDFVASKQHGGAFGDDLLMSREQDQKLREMALQTRMPRKMQGERRDIDSRSYESQMSQKRAAGDGRKEVGLEKQPKTTSPKSPGGDMYSPTRPTGHDDTEIPLVMESRKRKVSAGEGTEAKKSKSEKSEKKKKKRSRSRSKSREISKDKEGKKKKKKKEKDKEKSKHRKKNIEDSEKASQDMATIRKESKSESELVEKKAIELVSYPKLQRERKTSENDKAKDSTKEIMPPKILPPPAEVITKKQREQAREAMKKCASMFFNNNTLLKFAHAYGYVPTKRAEGLGDVPSPKPTNENTYSTSWCVLQFFMDKENMKFKESTKELVQFVLSDLDPENGFVWAALLALQENIMQEVQDYAEKNKELISQASADEILNKNPDKGDTDLLAKSKKGGNKLMAAFNQALKERKRAEMGLSSKATLSKLTPEQAAKKPAPKSSRPLFKPPIAYQLEKTDPDHETGVQREFYSINDIIKLSDNKLMDDLVKKLLLAFLRQTIESHENTDTTLSQIFHDSVQPIILKNIPSVRNLLNIALTFVSIFKEKQAENQPDTATNLISKPHQAPVPKDSEINEYGTSVSQASDSASKEEAGVNEYGSMANTTSAVETAANSESLAKVEKSAGTEITESSASVGEYGTSTTDSAVNEYGSASATVKEEKATPTVQQDEQFKPRENQSENLDSPAELKKGAIKFGGIGMKLSGMGETTKIPGIMDNEDEAPKSSASIEQSSTENQSQAQSNELENSVESNLSADVPKRQFRQRQGSDKRKYEREVEKSAKKSKDEKKSKESRKRKDETGTLELSEIDDGSQSALEKFRKVKEMKEKSSLDVRIAAILGDDSPRSEKSDSASKAEDTNEENIVIMKSEETVKSEPSKTAEISNGKPENTETEPLKDAAENSGASPALEETKKFQIGKKLVRSNKLLQAFKQQKTMGSRYACTSSQRVTASDILARLQAKERPATPTQRLGTPTKDEESQPPPQPMEIEDVSSPRMDENEDLYQQVFSKDSEALDIPMDSSPIDTSLNLAPGSEEKPPAVIGKAAVMYKPAEQSQGIQSLATAVPPSASMQNMNEEVQNGEHTPVEDDVPRSAAALLPPPPDDIPLPPAETPPPLPPESSQPQSFIVPQYSHEAQSYIVPTTGGDHYSQFAEYAAQYAAQNQNQYTEYPPATTVDTTATTGYGYDYSQYQGYDYNQQWSAAPYQQAWDQYYQQHGEAAPGYSQWQQWSDWNQQSQAWGQPQVPLPDMTMPPPGFNSAVPPPMYGANPYDTMMHGQRRMGKANIPMPSSNMRFYVFNKEKRLTKSVESFLTARQAKPFDPYNIQSTLQQPVQDFVVFIHRPDCAIIHMLPNLLQLKQEANIQFVTYNKFDDVRYGNLDSILVKGGQLTVDDTVLFETVPETVGDILKYMHQQSKEGTPWSFKIHRRTLDLIRAKKNTEEDEDQDRCRQIDELINYYGERGVVAVLEPHECDTGEQPSHVYQQCCLQLQSRNVKHFRHSLFLTKMPSNEAVACPFLDQGIGVLSVADFVQNIIGQECPEQLPDFPQRPSQKEKGFYCDAILSTGIDRLDLPFYDPETLLQDVDLYSTAVDQTYPPSLLEQEYQGEYQSTALDQWSMGDEDYRGTWGSGYGRNGVDRDCEPWSSAHQKRGRGRRQGGRGSKSFDRLSPDRNVPPLLPDVCPKQQIPPPTGDITPLMSVNIDDPPIARAIGRDVDLRSPPPDSAAVHQAFGFGRRRGSRDQDLGTPPPVDEPVGNSRDQDLRPDPLNNSDVTADIDIRSGSDPTTIVESASEIDMRQAGGDSHMIDGNETFESKEAPVITETDPSGDGPQVTSNDSAPPPEEQPV